MGISNNHKYWYAVFKIDNIIYYKDILLDGFINNSLEGIG